MTSIATVRRVKNRARLLPAPRHFSVADPQVMKTTADTGFSNPFSGAQP